MGSRSADLGDDIGYQQREWVAQRIGWSVMAVIVLAAVIGLLGDTGPLAKQVLQSPEGSLQVRHTRIEHHHAPALLAVTIAPEAVSAGEVRLWLDADYVESLSIQTIVPEPESVEVGSDRVVYTFTVAEQDGPVDVIFNYEQDGYWWKHGRLGIEGGESVELRQLVMP